MYKCYSSIFVLLFILYYKYCLLTLFFILYSGIRMGFVWLSVDLSLVFPWWNCTLVFVVVIDCARELRPVLQYLMLAWPPRTAHNAHKLLSADIATTRPCAGRAEYSTQVPPAGKVRTVVLTRRPSQPRPAPPRAALAGKTASWTGKLSPQWQSRRRLAEIRYEL